MQLEIRQALPPEPTVEEVSHVIPGVYLSKDEAYIILRTGKQQVKITMTHDEYRKLYEMMGNLRL